MFPPITFDKILREVEGRPPPASCKTIGKLTLAPELALGVSKISVLGGLTPKQEVVSAKGTGEFVAPEATYKVV